MEEANIKAPLFYVLGRDIEEVSLGAVHAVFSTTPCYIGVVSRHSDKTLIAYFVSEVLQALDESACRELAAHVARTACSPVLTVGEGKGLIAVYPGGEEEELCLSKLTSMS